MVVCFRFVVVKLVGFYFMLDGVYRNYFYVVDLFRVVELFLVKFEC